MQADIRELNIYPVKGLRGIAVKSAKLLNTGFEYDRYWMLVNPKNQFVSQRQIPRMALIETHIEGDRLKLTLDRNTIEIPFYHSNKESIDAVIWKDQVAVVEEQKEISNWLTKVLETPWPVRLVRMHECAKRYVDQSNKHPNLKKVPSYFSDGFPLLIANQASLESLNALAKETYGASYPSFPMNRFRANIILTASKPFVEHSFNKLTATNYSFSLDFPCERCVVTTIDQDSAVKDESTEPLKLLRQLNPMPNNPNGAAFGQNAQLVSGEGAIVTVGDRLTFF